MKRILGVFSAPQQHWVGDGFPVRSLFSYDRLGDHLSPFLLLDHAGPMAFEPTQLGRCVGEHPHRGFETVTIVYSGEVAHSDTAGAGGTIRAGDVQWMTAASGILNEEFHWSGVSNNGGTLEMMQLSVNLPAACKMSKAKYQDILDRDIPSVPLAGGAGTVRVIAGEFGGQRGPAETFTPLNVWDVRMRQGHEANFSFEEGHTLAIVVLRGNVIVNSETLRDEQFVLLDREGHDISIMASSDAVLLVLSGEPIEEPINGHGPFLMNTNSEIRQAISDFSSGKFCRI